MKKKSLEIRLNNELGKIFDEHRLYDEYGLVMYYVVASDIEEKDILFHSDDLDLTIVVTVSNAHGYIRIITILEQENENEKSNNRVRPIKRGRKV